MAVALTVEKPSALRSEVKLITPSLAKEYLGNQVKNRKWRRDIIERYKGEMIAGTWYLNGQAIIFDEHGRLIDGQHRLMAVMESGCSIRMLVISGVQSGLEKTIDTGKARTVGDVFQMNGVRNAKLLARTSKLLLIWGERFDDIVTQQGFTKGLMNVHPQRIYDFYIKNRLEIDRSCSDFKKNTVIITNTGSAVLSFVFSVLEKIDLDRCYAFITSFTSGNIKKEWPHMVKVRDDLMGRTRKSVIRLTESERISILFGVWNVVYHNSPVEDVERTLFNIPLELTKK